MRTKLFYLVLGIVLLIIGIPIDSTYAHASLIRSDPIANSVLAESPETITLWFTEPLETQFSVIQLRNSQGELLDLPDAQLAPNDSAQLMLQVGDLADDLYNVAWRVVSATDGHQTQGSFPFTIGTPVNANMTSETTITETIPLGSATIRWLNILSMATLLGSIAFWLFVWHPTVPSGLASTDRHIHYLVWFGWGFVGLSSILLVLLQTSLFTGETLLSVPSGDILKSIIVETHFGGMWLIRIGLWMLIGISLWRLKNTQLSYQITFTLCLLLLANHTSFSHVSGVENPLPAQVADWLHLVAMGMWVGGLLQFGRVLWHLKGNPQYTSTLVGYFSNFARMAVIILIITGTYSSYLLIGSIEALTTTAYGQALLIKLVLLLPLLGIAGINLFFTARGLKHKLPIWSTRLRTMVIFETVLAIGILGAVGIMTAIAPARNTLALRNSQMVNQETTSFNAIEDENGIQIELEISPGWIGENTFTIRLYDAEDNPIEDASLIRLRLYHQTENLGESEIRPEYQENGAYIVQASNLSLPGEWRIRATIQRPQEYDTVVDFNPTIDAPIIPETPTMDVLIPYQSQQIALLLIAIASIIIGGLFLREADYQPFTGGGILASFLLIAGGFFGISATQLTSKTADQIEAIRFVPSDSTPVTMAVSAYLDLSVLITQGGMLLYPQESGLWQPMQLESIVNDAYINNNGTLWVATDDGLFGYDNGAWQGYDTIPSTRLVMTHGYLFSLGEGEILRVGAGGIEENTVRELDIPITTSPPQEFVMLGSHSHVLQNGNQVFLSPDLGLSWQLIESPLPIETINVDSDGNLLAVTRESVMRWNWSTETWRTILPLPDERPISVLEVFRRQLYAIADGLLYTQTNTGWELVNLPDVNNIYLMDMAVVIDDTLWLLDAFGNQIWYSNNGQDWVAIPIEVEE